MIFTVSVRNKALYPYRWFLVNSSIDASTVIWCNCQFKTFLDQTLQNCNFNRFKLKALNMYQNLGERNILIMLDPKLTEANSKNNNAYWQKGSACQLGIAVTGVSFTDSQTHISLLSQCFTASTVNGRGQQLRSTADWQSVFPTDEWQPEPTGARIKHLNWEW